MHYYIFFSVVAEQKFKKNTQNNRKKEKRKKIQKNRAKYKVNPFLKFLSNNLNWEIRSSHIPQ